MSKKFSIVIAILLVLAVAFAIVGCGEKDPAPTPTPGPGTTDIDVTGSYDLKIWVSEIEGVTTLTQSQIDAFEAANPGIVINATISGVGEGDAATQVIADVESAPDLYCFAQDQLARLVQAGALAEIGGVYKTEIANNNDGGAVKAGQVGDKQYAYPLTSDNGYFMYYDKSVLSEEDVMTLEGIIAVCEAKSKFFNFELQNNAWYSASFFFATGCESQWSANSDGEFDGVHDTWNSDAGVVALKGMQKLLKSTCYQSTSSAFDGAAAVVTGSWNSGAAATAYGANLGATKLPTFTVDGKTYQLGSFTGNKMMGVKPQTDVKRSIVLQKLASYLAGEDCQKARFEQFGWGPSNKNLQASDAVQSDITQSAFAAQAEFGIPQGNIHGDWWSIAATIVDVAKVATTDAELKAALQTYQDEINLRADPNWVPPEVWGVCGTINGWNGDEEMALQDDGSYMTVEPITFAAGAEFKVRQNATWGVAFGNNTDNADPENGNRGNFVVETAGTYYVKIVFTIDGEARTAVISLVPAE
ncbi:MAG: extracellular solute-binding protein [Clostridia bacterium]|nr:extracellular solute-binding protein [Clostridia bacterium]